MRIESVIRRAGGTVVTFDKKSQERLGLPLGSYHFQPIDPKDPDSPHVADVNNLAHRDHFLTIRSFRVFDGPVPGPVKAPDLGAAVTPDGFDAAEFQRRAVRAIKDGLSDLNADQVRAVLELEQQDAECRQSVVDICMARLRALES